MDFSKAQIAALVLGYLRLEKWPSVVDSFLKSCPYLNKSYAKNFVTRVGGMTLVDYLEEYSEIYIIVQARIHETDCYERYTRPTLVQQLLCLLDKEQPVISTSTPIMSAPCEVETSPAHELPGNSSVESDSSIPKTPKRRSTKSKSKEIEKVMDMTEVLTQSLLEKHELHEKIAETINIVMNTPEVTKTMLEEHISAGASKELDAVIKTVIQRTEEDPLYNRLIDELIIGTTSSENQKKMLPCSTPTTSMDITDIAKSQPVDATHTQNQQTDPMDDHNNDAIRSIIEAAQNNDPPPAPPQPEIAPTDKSDPQPNDEVYVFNGNLDTYLKTSGVTNTINSNPFYFNPGGLIAVPLPETAKQFCIVNNLPLIKMNGPTVVTEKEIMSMPTVIVNDENPSTTTPCIDKQTKRNKNAKSKVSENAAKVSDNAGPKAKSESAPEKIRVTEGLLMPAQRDNVVITRQASHVRNLDFSTPSCRSDGSRTQKKNHKSWDEDLRQLIGSCKDKSPSPKKKRSAPNKKKGKKVEEKPPEEEEEKEKEHVEERENASLLTPIKDCVPKTPGGTLDTSSLHCTPFTAVLEEQLQGVDINSLPTPSLPITPGFALTPGDILCTNQRLTDYSTSSSYYQPSDSEQKMTMIDLIEENKKLDNLLPEKPAHVNIISNVVLEKSKNSLIGKKNLSLIKRTLSSSSSDSESESDLETTTESTNKTIICKPNSSKKHNAAAIKEIISNVEVKNTLEDESRKNILSQLEEVRRRTVHNLKQSEVTKKQPVRGSRKKTGKTPKTPKVPKRNMKKKAASTEENTDEEAQKLVKGMAERGIHLIHNKTPNKQSDITERCVDESEEVTFDTRTYEECEVVTHENKSCRRRNSKSYDFTVLKKSMSVKVFINDVKTETRVIKWTDSECIFDSSKVTPVEEISEHDEDELMDYCIVGSVREESPDANETKGGRKRKFTDDDGNKDKRSKTSGNLHLLKKIDVDDFLNKVHGE